MTAFMKESGVEARNGHPHRREILQSHFIRVTFTHIAFKYPQLTGHHKHNFLIEQPWITNTCDSYLARTVIDDFVKEGRSWLSIVSIC